MIRPRKHMKRSSVIAALAVSLTALGFAASASAQESEFSKFDYCPTSNPEVFKCLYSVTEGGEVVLGKKTVPIVNPVTLQGGFSQPNAENISRFFGATNGETLSKTPQPVPGGLLGIVPPEDSPPLVKALVEAVAENGLTGVNATLELARPASEIRISEFNLVAETGVALKLPVKVHLENPFLGPNCYVGSSSSPIIWNLTTAETNPPPPNMPIQGNGGMVEFREEGNILHLDGSVLVDNAWSAPGASGCGGPVLELLVNPIIDSQVGLPSPAGNNTAILENTSDVALAETVSEN